MSAPATLAGTRPEPPPEDTRELFCYLRATGDPAARDELVHRFMPLARSLARRYRRGSEPLDDLVQVASLALVKAVDRFDPEKGTAFSSYAVPSILGELRRHFRDHGWAAHVPRSGKDGVVALERASADLAGRLGRAPRVSELAEQLDLSHEDVSDLLQAAQALESLSLDAPVNDGGDGSSSLGETLGFQDESFEAVDDGLAVSSALPALPDRERHVLYLRFFEDLTQAQIAERVGVSQMQVSRVLRRALERLRAIVEARSTVG